MERIEEIRKRLSEIARANANGIGAIRAWEVVKEYITDIDYLLEALEAKEAINKAYKATVSLDEANAQERNEIIDKYATAARVIVLYLDKFCDRKLQYDEMIAQAARTASDELDHLTAELAGYMEAEADGRILPDCNKCALRGFGDCILSNCIGKAKWSDTDNEFAPINESALTKGGE